MRRDAERIFDEYLAAAARAGDRAAFGRLAQRWQARLLAHAFRLTGDGEMARDVVQDAWRDIVNSLPRLKDAAVFPAWAYRIVTRRAADTIRRTQRDRRTVAAYAVEPKNNEVATGAMEAAADGGALNKVIAALPPGQRAAVALHYKEGFSVAEVAVALEVPAGTVKTRLMHARRKMRDALEGGKSNERS